MVVDVFKIVFDVPSQIDVPPLKNNLKKKFFIFGKWLIDISDVHIDQVIEDTEEEDIKKIIKKKTLFLVK